MLSKDLEDFIRGTEQSGGLDTSKLPDGTLVKLRTDGSTYHILFIEAARGIAVIQDVAKKYFPEPWPCMMHGSTAGGSMVKVGWICFGSRIRFEGLLNGLLVTRAVERMGIELVNDEERKQSFRTVYDTIRVVTKEEFASQLKQIIDGFPSDLNERTTKVIDQFCAEGQTTMLGFLVRANEIGRLESALALLEEQLEKHWSYRPPSARGRLLTPSDVEYVDRLYRSIGLSFLR